MTGRGWRAAAGRELFVRLEMLALPMFLGAVSAGAQDGMTLKLSKCIADDPHQTFKRVLVPPYTAPIAVEVGAGFCLDLADYRTTAKRDRPPANTSRPAVGSIVNAWSCGANAWTNQYWEINHDTLATLQPEADSLCLGLSEVGSGSLVKCSSPEAQLSMQLSGKKNSTIVHKQSGLCVTATGTTPPVLPPPPHPPPGPPNTPCPPKPHRNPEVIGRLAPQGDRPCDIYLAGGTPCVAAHSTVRALFGAYSGKLYTVQRKSDYSSIDISVIGTGGYADAASQDKFCAGTDCEILVIFDQSPQGNHLVSRHPGRHSPVDYGVNASAQPVTIAGHRVYGARFDPGMGYRNDHTTGLALNDEPESIYAVMGGDHYNDVCCTERTYCHRAYPDQLFTSCAGNLTVFKRTYHAGFDYGNAENHMGADGAGTMEAIVSFGHSSAMRL